MVTVNLARISLFTEFTPFTWPSHIKVIDVHNETRIASRAAEKGAGIFYLKCFCSLATKIILKTFLYD